MSSSSNSTIRHLKVEEEEDPDKPRRAVEHTMVPQPVTSQVEGILPILVAISRALATRFLLLLTIIGGFVLAIMAMQTLGYPSLFVLCAYSVLIIIPLVWMDYKGRR